MKLTIATVIVSLVTFASCLDVPTQVHIALAGQAPTGESNSMAVSWHTEGKTPSSTVKYGTKPGTYTWTASGLQSTYYETWNHHVVLGELAPNTKYYYVVGDEASGWSKELSFVSAPLSSALRGNFSFFVFGDLGVENGDPSNDYITAHKDSVSFIWHAGDVSYADDAFLHAGCVTRFCYEETFDEYLSRAEVWASQIPYMTTPGNHEADCHDPSCLLDKERREKLSNFTAYNGRFRMPSPETGGVLNMHYSFNFGNVHFISIDTETGYPGAPGETRYVLPCGGFGEQLSWLEKDLQKAQAERALRPWIFVAGHHPMYQGDSINVEFQTAMEELFYKYGVDVYFSGHVHHYERNYPVYHGTPETTYTNPRAPVHMLIGGAGNDEMDDIQRTAAGDPSPREGPGKTRWWASTEAGGWTVLSDEGEHVGIGQVTVLDDSNIRFDYIRTKSQEVYDGFTLYRDHAPFIPAHQKK